MAPGIAEKAGRAVAGSRLVGPCLSVPALSPHLEKRVALKLASVHWIPKLTMEAVSESSVLDTKKISEAQFTRFGGKIYDAGPASCRPFIKKHPALSTIQILLLLRCSQNLASLISAHAET